MLYLCKTGEWTLIAPQNVVVEIVLSLAAISMSRFSGHYVKSQFAQQTMKKTYLIIDKYLDYGFLSPVERSIS